MSQQLRVMKHSPWLLAQNRLDGWADHAEERGSVPGGLVDSAVRPRQAAAVGLCGRARNPSSV